MNRVQTAALSRGFRISVLAAASPLMLAGCGGPDLGSMRSGPIPEKAPELTEGDLPPEPGDDAPFAAKVEWNLVESTSRFARTTDPEAAAECPKFDTSQDSEIVCTVVFRGAEAEWEVTINGGRFFASSEMLPRGRQVVRDVAEDMLRFETDTKTVRCDMDKVHVVPVQSGGEDEPVTCEWGRAEDSWKTEERQGTVRIQTSSPAAGMGGSGFWFASPEEQGSSGDGSNGGSGGRR
ncbi:hypothetical protein GCM10027570_46510 [Streptomonospora sediminis]